MQIVNNPMEKQDRFKLKKKENSKNNLTLTERKTKYFLKML